MASKPAFQKGEGPNQLPQGGATELNAMPETLSADAGAAQAAQGAAEAGQAPASGETPGTTGQEPQPAPHPINDVVPNQIPEAPVNFTPQSEEDKFLFEPGQGGMQGAQPGASMTEGPLPVPRGVSDWLPSLQMAAQDPNSSPQTKALFQLVTYHLNQGG
jgi:hypothetical protein